MKTGPKPVSVEERFWRYVSPEPNSGCWLWVGSLNKGGYGQLGVKKGQFGAATKRPKVAHIIAWELYRGPIPDGFQLDHLCRVRSCVNPDHLEPVICRTNLARGMGFVGQNLRKTHCPQGHEYTKENTYLTRRGERNCRACRKLPAKIQYHKEYREAHRQEQRDYMKRYYAKKKAEGNAAHEASAMP